MKRKLIRVFAVVIALVIFVSYKSYHPCCNANASNDPFPTLYQAGFLK